MADDIARTTATVALPLSLGQQVPEVYVDGYHGVAYKDGVIKLNFFSLALDPTTNDTCREVVLRMAASVNTVMQVHAALGQLLDDLRTSGVPQR